MTDGTIENALQALYRAMLAHDIAALDGLLTDDTVYVHSTGLAETKSAFLNGIRDGLYEYEQVQPVSQHIRTSGDMAVVYTILDFRGGKRGGGKRGGGKRGQPHPNVSLITTLVWVRRDDAWRMAIRQATRIP